MLSAILHLIKSQVNLRRVYAASDLCGGLILRGIVTYNDACRYITIDSFYLEYADGTSETEPYNYMVQAR